MNVPHSKTTSLLALAGYLVASVFAALLGGYFTAQVTITALYAALAKPAWAPPAWLFGPVWSLLYISMSVAIWLVWRKKSIPPAKSYAAQRCWWTQLALNAGWPVVFWLQPAGVAAFVACAALAVTVWGCIVIFRPVSSLAAVLMLPYAVWVSFAATLSWALWRMNSVI